MQSKKAMALVAEELRSHLLDQVMGFWARHTLDPTGGYHTCLDREGRLMANEKNIWMQARQVWMFSRIYSHVATEEKWLALARHGRDYLVRSQAYAGKGRWNYLLSPQNGQVEAGTLSVYTDAFALMGLCGYAMASGEREDVPLIRETFKALEQNLLDPDFPSLFPNVYQPGVAVFGVPMIGLYAAAQAVGVLGLPVCAPLMGHCVDQMMGLMLDREAGCFLEKKHRDGSRLEGAEGRMVNPGHNFEGLWFLMEQANALGRPADGDLAARMVLDMWRRARDPLGGVYYMLETDGPFTGPCDWNRQRALQWDEKVWWTHGEALAALLHAAKRLGSPQALEAFHELLDYCLAHFPDPVYGEWYSVLHRDGTPRLLHKGGLQKAAFHVPRALCECYLLAKEMSQ